MSLYKLLVLPPLQKKSEKVVKKKFLYHFIIMCFIVGWLRTFGRVFKQFLLQ